MSRPAITVFSRPGCHLCTVALDRIGEILGEEGSREVHLVDIESSEELLAAYLERIPVIEVDGREVSDLEFDETAFLEAIGFAPGTPGQVA